MRPFFFCLLFTVLFHAASAQNERKDFDSVMARDLGADQYGMHQYVMAFLKPGKTQVKDSSERALLMQAHLKNIGRMAREGKLVLAGPFLDKGPWSGIYIFNVATVEEARQLTGTDPAIKAGVFEMELHPWYGSAALMKVTEIHGRIQKVNITD
jgi:uncharacterized protein YciI